VNSLNFLSWRRIHTRRSTHSSATDASTHHPTSGLRVKPCSKASAPHRAPRLAEDEREAHPNRQAINTTKMVKRHTRLQCPFSSVSSGVEEWRAARGGGKREATDAPVIADTSSPVMQSAHELSVSASGGYRGLGGRRGGGGEAMGGGLGGGMKNTGGLFGRYAANRGGGLGPGGEEPSQGGGDGKAGVLNGSGGGLSLWWK
jgi:hypothetical protein